MLFHVCVQILRTLYSTSIFRAKIVFHSGQNCSTVTQTWERSSLLIKLMIKPSFPEFKRPRAISPSTQTSFSGRPDCYIFTITVFTQLTAKETPHLASAEKGLTCPPSRAHVHSPALELAAILCTHQYSHRFFLERRKRHLTLCRFLLKKAAVIFLS